MTSKSIGVIFDTNFASDVRIRKEVLCALKNGYKIGLLTPFSLDKDDHLFKEYIASSKLILHKTIVGNKFLKKLKPLINTLPLFNWIWKREITGFINVFKPDILHVHDLYLGNPAYLAIRTSKTKQNLFIVLDLHENYVEAINHYKWATKWPNRIIVRPNHWRKKEKRILRMADHIIGLSQSYLNHLRSQYNFVVPKRFTIYQNVPDITEFREDFANNKVKLPINDSDYVIFYFGVVSAVRGIIETVEAVHQINLQDKSVKFLCIGPTTKTEQKFFKNLFKKHNQEVIYIPWIKLSQLSSYIHYADVCISPIHKNKKHDAGVANKVFQYMYFKKPVIVSDSIEQESLILKYQAGLTFKSKNIQELQRKILFLKDNPKLAKQMGELGHEAIVNELNQSRTCPKLIDIYESFQG